MLQIEKLCKAQCDIDMSGKIYSYFLNLKPVSTFDYYDVWNIPGTQNLRIKHRAMRLKMHCVLKSENKDFDGVSDF